ncbi:UPF0575 protein C19orf67 homolog isoform X1 [Xyrichtys novacula]|uniref:UPF0575 protein C19orf67 homolog isoform X1 n=1 Tax=Xyrichtys novacula TaxID=13765 RepID=A0AAV1EY95_XYRNO|nr:UPF0575 protein C19orf67 homolog isoform X1 [Xyrichtys novacula]
MYRYIYTHNSTLSSLVKLLGIKRVPRKKKVSITEVMTDGKVQVDVQLPDEQTYTGLQEYVSGQRDLVCMEGLQHTGQGEDRETLLMLAEIALVPPCGDNTPCSYDCSCEVRHPERCLQSMQLQLSFLLSEADHLQDFLVNGQVGQARDDPADILRRFLCTCQPYFNLVESTMRSTVNICNPLHSNIYRGLFYSSQQLCDRLEQLVLACAGYNLVCLDETEPNSVSQFCIGQIHLGQLKVTIFRYVTPTPYLSRVNMGLYKRMRWNVERLQDGAQQLQQTGEGKSGGSMEGEEDTVSNTEYYFLCCEDVPNPHTNYSWEDQGFTDGNFVRMWSIGQWVQVDPNPNTEDICDWILCEVPQAQYRLLLSLSQHEPSNQSATDSLLRLLLEQE